MSNNEINRLLETSIKRMRRPWLRVIREPCADDDEHEFNLRDFCNRCGWPRAKLFERQFAATERE